MLINVNKLSDCLRESDKTAKLEHPDTEIALWYSIYTKWQRGTLHRGWSPPRNAQDSTITQDIVQILKMYEWVQKSNQGVLQAYCTVCSTHFSVSHGGINDVKNHGEGKNHIDLFRAKSLGNKMTSFFRSSKESDMDQSVIMAETLFSELLAEHNAPFALSDHFTKLVKRIFPDSNMLKSIYVVGARVPRNK